MGSAVVILIGKVPGLANTLSTDIQTNANQSCAINTNRIGFFAQLHLGGARTRTALSLTLMQALININHGDI